MISSRVNPDMKAELNVSVKGGNFDLNNKYLADMNVREAANIVFSMKQSDTVSEDVIRNEIRQKIWEQYGTEFPLTIEKVSYTESSKEQRRRTCRNKWTVCVPGSIGTCSRPDCKAASCASHKSRSNEGRGKGAGRGSGKSTSSGRCICKC